MHLIARMLDPTYEPHDARTLMRTLTESLRSMLGHGVEDWGVRAREAMAEHGDPARPRLALADQRVSRSGARRGNHPRGERSSNGDRSQ